MYSCVSSNKSCRNFFKTNALMQGVYYSKQDSMNYTIDLVGLLKREPYCLKALQVFGYLQFMNQNFSVSKEYFLRAEQVDSANPYSLFYLSMLNNFEGENEKALSIINKAIQVKTQNGYVIDKNNFVYGELDIKYADMRHFRGIINFELGKLKWSKQDFLYCLSQNIVHDDTYGYLASIYKFEGRLDSACMYHFKSVNIGMDNVIDTSLIRICNSN